MIRRSKPLRRSTAPIPRKVRPRPRRKGTVAATRRKLNLLWSAIIRASNGGRCWMAGRDDLRCSGPIQAAHCFGKKAFPCIRFDLWNGVPLCRSHHCLYSYRVESWNYILMQTWGMEIYAERYREANRAYKLPLETIQAELETAARNVGVA